jgi:DNA-binding XRE family transcriptional regulator
MNNFERLVIELESVVAETGGVELEIGKPLRPDGVWVATLHGADGFTVEAEWKLHRGFWLIAGYDLEPYDGAHECYATWEIASDRMIALWSAREATTRNLPVPVAELRKLRGQLQKDVAAQMGITKGGLAQIEASANEGKVQVDTLSKLVQAMGGRLVISAAFPDGTERKVAIGR